MQKGETYPERDGKAVKRYWIYAGGITVFDFRKVISRPETPMEHDIHGKLEEIEKEAVRIISYYKSLVSSLCLDMDDEFNGRDRVEKEKKEKAEED